MNYELTKPLLRKEIKARKAACTLEEKECLSTLLQQRVLQHPRWKAAEVIYLYVALPDEVSTSLLLQTALAEGKQLLLPRVKGDDLEWVNIHTLEALREGAYHILEPQGEAFQTQTQTQTQTTKSNHSLPFGFCRRAKCRKAGIGSPSSLALIPGIAFTRDGKRLGRGKGFYDRFLTQHPHLYKIGLCWPFQIIEDLPTEPHDIKMDAVIY